MASRRMAGSSRTETICTGSLFVNGRAGSAGRLLLPAVARRLSCSCASTRLGASALHIIPTAPKASGSGSLTMSTSFRRLYSCATELASVDT